MPWVASPLSGSYTLGHPPSLLSLSPVPQVNKLLEEAELHGGDRMVVPGPLLRLVHLDVKQHGVHAKVLAPLPRLFVQEVMSEKRTRG